MGLLVLARELTKPRPLTNGLKGKEQRILRSDPPPIPYADPPENLLSEWEKVDDPFLNEKELEDAIRKFCSQHSFIMPPILSDAPWSDRSLHIECDIGKRLYSIILTEYGDEIYRNDTGNFDNLCYWIITDSSWNGLPPRIPGDEIYNFYDVERAKMLLLHSINPDWALMYRSQYGQKNAGGDFVLGGDLI